MNQDHKTDRGAQLVTLSSLLAVVTGPIIMIVGLIEALHVFFH